MNWKLRRAVACMIWICGLAVCLGVGASQAASPRTIAVYGDSQATDVFYALRSLVSRDSSFRVLRRTRGGTGLVRDDQYDWFARMKRYIAEDKPHVVVIGLGGNDRQSFQFPDRGSIERFTDRWWREYKVRVQMMMDLLATSGAKAYWLSLPRVRSDRMSQDYRKFNDIYARVAKRTGVVFIDSSDIFETSSGGFKTFVLDDAGRRHPLRRSDGIHYSDYGAGRLASTLMTAIKAHGAR